MDAINNFAYSTVATAPSPATSGTSLVVGAGQGTRFPAPPFNAVIWPSGSSPLSSNAEIVRVTAISTDTFTITRTQESTSARTVVVGDQIAQCITKKTIDDIFNGQTFILGAGTASVAALKMTTGVNLTTPTAGAFEYDGKVFYVTSLANERNIIGSKQYLIQGADRTGNNSNTAQKVFDTATNGAITVTAATTYRFELFFYMIRSAGTTAHTTGISFGGTATLTSFLANTIGVSNTSAAGTSVFLNGIMSSAANYTVTASSNSASENCWIKVNGIIRVNAAGTIIPQFTYSAAPGGAPTIKANSYFFLEIWGTNTQNSVGNWS